MKKKTNPGWLNGYIGDEMSYPAILTQPMAKRLKLSENHMFSRKNVKFFHLNFDGPGRLREYSWDYFINHDIRIPEPEPTRMTHGFRKGPRCFLTVAAP